MFMFIKFLAQIQRNNSLTIPKDKCSALNMKYFRLVFDYQILRLLYNLLSETRFLRMYLQLHFLKSFLFRSFKSFLFKSFLFSSFKSFLLCIPRSSAIFFHKGPPIAIGAFEGHLESRLDDVTNWKFSNYHLFSSNLFFFPLLNTALLWYCFSQRLKPFGKNLRIEKFSIR